MNRNCQCKDVTGEVNKDCVICNGTGYDRTRFAIESKFAITGNRGSTGKGNSSADEQSFRPDYVEDSNA